LKYDQGRRMWGNRSKETGKKSTGETRPTKQERRILHRKRSGWARSEKPEAKAGPWEEGKIVGRKIRTRSVEKSTWNWDLEGRYISRPGESSFAQIAELKPQKTTK